MRFERLADCEQFPDDGETCWYFDTERPLVGEGQPYVAVQCYCDRDPNQFVRHEKMFLLFQDQCEYYAVCENCYLVFKHMQWAGSTHSPDWRLASEKYLNKHVKEKGWCEFCDRVFGNGGWYVRRPA